MAFNQTLVKDVTDGLSLVVTTVEAQFEGQTGVSDQKKQAALDLFWKSAADAGFVPNSIVKAVLNFCIPLLIDFLVKRATDSGFFSVSKS